MSGEKVRSIMPVGDLEERLKAALTRTAALPQTGELKVFRAAVEEALGHLETMKNGEPQKFGLNLVKKAEFVLGEFDKKYPVVATGEKR
jgi:hypothetical protein